MSPGGTRAVGDEGVGDGGLSRRPGSRALVGPCPTQSDC